MAKKKTTNKKAVKAAPVKEQKAFNLGKTDEIIIKKFHLLIRKIKDQFPNEKITNPRALEIVIDHYNVAPKQISDVIEPGHIIVDEKDFNEIKETYSTVWDDKLLLEENIFACLNAERNTILSLKENHEPLLKENKFLSDETKALKDELQQAQNQINELKEQAGLNRPLNTGEIEASEWKNKFTELQNSTQALTTKHEDVTFLYEKLKNEFQTVQDNALHLVDPQFICEFDEELTQRALTNKPRIIKLGAIDADLAPDEYPGQLCIIATDFYLSSIENMYVKKK